MASKGKTFSLAVVACVTTNLPGKPNNELYTYYYYSSSTYYTQYST